MSLVMIDGAVAQLAEARLDVTDIAVLRGYGVFEVIAVEAAIPVLPEPHFARLKRSADALFIPVDLDLVRSEFWAFLDAVERTEYEVRLLVTGAGRRVLIEEELPTLPPVMRLALVDHEFTPLLVGVKSTSYAANIRARELAQRQGCDDALFLSRTSGRVLECPTSTFVWEVDERLATPPLEDGVLPSITRAIAVEHLDVAERVCTLDELRRASGACILGTGVGAVPVVEVAPIVSFSSVSPTVRDFVTNLRQETNRLCSAPTG